MVDLRGSRSLLQTKLSGPQNFPKASGLSPDQVLIRMKADEYFHYSQAHQNQSIEISRRLPKKNAAIFRQSLNSISKDLQLNSKKSLSQIRTIEQMVQNRAQKINATNIHLAKRIERQSRDFQKIQDLKDQKQGFRSTQSDANLIRKNRNNSKSSNGSNDDYKPTQRTMLRNQSKWGIDCSLHNARRYERLQSEQRNENIKMLERLQQVPSQYVYEPIAARAEKFDKLKKMHAGGKCDLLVGSFKSRHLSIQPDSKPKKMIHYQSSQSQLKLIKNPSQASLSPTSYKIDRKDDKFRPASLIRDKNQASSIASTTQLPKVEDVDDYLNSIGVDPSLNKEEPRITMNLATLIAKENEDFAKLNDKGHSSAASFGKKSQRKQF